MWAAAWLVWLTAAGGAGDDFTAACPAPCECRWQSGSKAASCTRADLHAVPRALSPDLQSLDLSDNPLRALPAAAFRRAGLANLQRLALRACALERLHAAALADLAILIELDLSHNQLAELGADTFRDTVRLRWLNLAHNRLETLPPGLLRDLRHLQRVQLTDNRLVALPPQALASLPRLHTLRLDGNLLATLSPVGLAALPALASLDLHDNPWRCDCHLRPLREYTLARNLYTAPTACAEPPQLARRLWSDVPPERFACAPRLLPLRPHDASELGRDATLACGAAADPAPRLTWLHDARPLRAEPGRYRLADGRDGDAAWLNLTVVVVRASDRGNYTCVADNAGGSVAHTRALRPRAATLPRLSALLLLSCAGGACALFAGAGALVCRRRLAAADAPLKPSSPHSPPHDKVGALEKHDAPPPRCGADSPTLMPHAASASTLLLHAFDAGWRRAGELMPGELEPAPDLLPCSHVGAAWRYSEECGARDEAPSPAPGTPHRSAAPHRDLHALGDLHALRDLHVQLNALPRAPPAQV